MVGVFTAGCDLGYDLIGVWGFWDDTAFNGLWDCGFWSITYSVATGSSITSGHGASSADFSSAGCFSATFYSDFADDYFPDSG